MDTETNLRLEEVFAVFLKCWNVFSNACLQQCCNTATLQHCNTSWKSSWKLGLELQMERPSDSHIWGWNTPKLSLVIAKPEKEQEQEKEAACNFNPFLGRNLWICPLPWSYIRGHLDRLMAIVAIIFLSAFVASLQGRVLVEPENAAFYRQSGLRDLKRALKAPRFEGKAKNVIMFVGDGM